MNWLHTIFELSMVIALFVAIKELRQMQRHMSAVHAKVCDDNHDNDVHLGV